jgi:hypothetical protein
MRVESFKAEFAELKVNDGIYIIIKNVSTIDGSYVSEEIHINRYKIPHSNQWINELNAGDIISFNSTLDEFNKPDNILQVKVIGRNDKYEEDIV